MTISDIQSRVYFLTKTNSGSYTNADMLIAINNAYEHVVSLIMRSDGAWQWDDTARTDLPIATTDLVASQQDYTLATSHLSIDRVEVKDTAGNWHLLKQIDQQELKGERAYSLAEYQETAGTPLEYDVSGATVMLYPKPNYSQTNSLKIYFTRGPDLFTSADMTAGDTEPGFNSLFHELLPLYVAYDYAIANAQPSANGLFNTLMERERRLVEFYSLRNRDYPSRLQGAYQDNR